jgi:UDP-N-acetylglucosamine 2-epimerase (non-hydrolysing)
LQTVLTLFGTRPEVIKLAPVIRALEARAGRFRTVNVTSAQHRELLYPFTEFFGIRLDHDLQVMEEDQTPSQVCARVLLALDSVLESVAPDLLLVQGDTTTTLAGALAGFHRRIPVGHVEAGLRTGDPSSPFPEEMNRRLTTRLASLHLAATPRNVETLLSEGVPSERIALTGNPVVDSLLTVRDTPSVSEKLSALGRFVGERKLIVLTTHRRESFGALMRENLRVLRGFVERHDDVTLVFPVHPNPAVQEQAQQILGGAERVRLVPPLDYLDFVRLLAMAWLVVSDSGGIQEEAPSLGKPVLVLRENTERAEAIEAGVARLVGNDPSRLRELLEEAYPDHPWLHKARGGANPFGRGDAGPRIVAAIEQFLRTGSAAVREKTAESARG